jgi:2-(1,2-epoxy-1,2-dihydrophenyl)acetyl-CoA isomerase
LSLAYHGERIKLAMDLTTLLFDAADGVATVTLNRPDVLNAFNADMRRELRRVFETVGGDDTVRAVVLTAAGRGFCAGQDLRERLGSYEQGQAPVLGETLRREYNPLIMAMRELPKPIVGAINGVAAGAGCSLALACDLRVASEQASFLQAFVRIGLVPDSGSSFFLPQLIGMARAAEMMFLAEPVSPARALELGLVTQVVPADQLVTASRELARKLAQLPTKAIGQAKRQLNLALSAGLEAVLEEEAEGQAMASQTHDHLEGVHAFLAKREPRFTGR